MPNIKTIQDYLKNEHLSFSFKGNPQIMVEGFSPLKHPKEKTITWIKEPSKFNIASLKDFKDLLIVTTFEGQTLYKDSHQSFIFCKDPKEVFFMILTAFFQTETYMPGIHPTAVVESNQIGKNVHIGCHTYIGKNVAIGDNVVIKNNVSIEGKVSIGDNTLIHSGVVIGLEGFGFFKNENGNNTRVPHFGGVKIGHDVEIGANSCISRGTLDDTVIGNYVKFDNLSHVGHNVVIEDNCTIILSTLSGSVHIGENSYIGVRSVVKNQVTIGKNCLIGMAAAVTKDVEDNKVVAGVPAKVLRDNG